MIEIPHFLEIIIINNPLNHKLLFNNFLFSNLIFNNLMFTKGVGVIYDEIEEGGEQNE
jgi:hypothetical protein